MSSHQRPGYWEAFAEVAAASSCLGDFAHHVLELRSLQSPWMDQRRGLQEWLTELPGHVGFPGKAAPPAMVSESGKQELPSGLLTSWLHPGMRKLVPNTHGAGDWP